ncbi:MAG: helix-turn-helix domain-containing protein [Ruminococcus sp.]|jgi:two-component system response regulator YesN
MKILIVDDEVPIRKYISQMISNCSGEHEIIGSVGSGKKALEIIAQRKPDLVLADITMPKMTGLELLEKVKEYYPDIEVFMLTCHNDFEFARAAIKLQADNYILKDEISPVFLENLLKSTEEKREKSWQKSMHQFESSAFFIQMMKEDTLLFDSYDLEKHKIFLKDKEFFAAALTDSRENRERIVAFKSSLMENQEIFPYHDTNLIMIANLVESGKGRLREDFYGMVGKLRSRVDGPVGISAVYYKINMLKKAVLESLDSYGRIYYGKRVQVGSLETAGISDGLKMEIHNFAGRAYQLISEKKYRKLFLHLKDMVSFAAQNNTDVFLLKKSLHDILTDYQIKSGRDVDLDGIHKSVGADQLFLNLEEMCREEEKKRASYSDAVNEAISYIENHFGENISLTDVAERIHLNAEYFSRRFKKETGSKFSEFLQKIRMEEAHRLLLTTELSVTEIASRTGFNNDSYFSAAFKKYFGENPAEARKSREKS